MTDSRPSVDFNELLAHADWVRAVARELAGNSAQADDLVQDTWVAALHRPPREAGNLRAWLQRVLSNQARQRGRTEGRRRRREEAVARPESAPSMNELAERVALQREVVGHVLALDEPFRSVVLLRFFEELTPPQVAERLGIPLKTVHSRQQRAFEKLRAKLAREHGDAWCTALVPLVVGHDILPAASGGALAATAGAWIMNMNAKTAAAIAVALISGIGLWRLNATAPVDLEPRAASEATPGASLAKPRTTALPSLGSAQSRLEDRTALAQSPQATAPIGVSEDERFSIRGRAVDLSGLPLPGVPIALDGALEEVLAKTAPDGSFEASLVGSDENVFGGQCLQVADERWATLRQSCVKDTNRDLEHIVVAAPAVRLEGWVEDPGGAPVAGARITLSPRGKEFYGFPYALDMTSFLSRDTVTGSGGDFAFERFPEAPGLYLHVSADGFVTQGVRLDELPRPLVVRLEPLADSDQVFLEGVVLDERGRTVEGARVQLAEAKARTDHAGLFRIVVDDVAQATPLCAAHEDHLPALIPNFGQVIEAQGGAPIPVELILGGAPLEIRGRVVDDSGDPCVGWFVSACDEVEISQHRIPIDTAEGLGRGGPEVVETDAEGRFRLTGLFARDYRVQAYDRETLLRTEALVAAGDRSAELRVAGALREPLRGTVVSRRGDPMPDVRVTVALNIVESSIGSHSISGESFVTDESGVFELDEVPADHVYLRCSGESVLPSVHEIEGDESALELVVTQRCHFRIELSGAAAAADTAEFHDADGTRLQINRFQANGMSASGTTPLDDGRSEVLSVSELATTLILSKDGSEIGRHGVTLRADEVNVLSF